MRVPPELHEQIMSLVAKGQSMQQVADWLGTKGITVGKQTVHAIVKKNRAERAEVTKAVYAEHAKKDLPGDLADLATIRKTNRTLLKKAQRVMAKKTTVANAQMVKMLSDAVERAAEAEAKARGLNEPESAATSTLAEILGRKL